MPYLLIAYICTCWVCAAVVMALSEATALTFGQQPLGWIFSLVAVVLSPIWIPIHLAWMLWRRP